MILYLDVETTGLVNFKKKWDDPCQPHILSIGAIGYSDDGLQEVYSQYAIIRPDGYVIDNNSEAIKVNGITQEIAMDYGIRYKAALISLEHICYKASRIVIYNAEFEAAMFEIERQRLNDPNRKELLPRDKTLCLKLAMARIIGETGMYDGEYKWHKFHVAYKHIFGVEPENQHHALHDTRQSAWLSFEIVRQGLWSFE